MIEIEDQFDVDSAEKLVALGYPDNKESLADLLFWSCFPNDPVAWITAPYILSLKTEELAPALAAFIEFHLRANQRELIDDVFCVVDVKEHRGISELTLSHISDPLIRRWAASKKILE